MNTLPRLILITVLMASLPIYAASVSGPERNVVQGNPAESMLLPEDMSVYVKDDVVINHSEFGFTRVILPTRNLFAGAPGGYIACYSRSRAGSVYGVGGGIYVMGQIRVPGHYNERIFEPDGYQGKDISAADKFKKLCRQTFSSCQQSCWAGGDTGGWFGIQ